MPYVITDDLRDFLLQEHESILENSKNGMPPSQRVKLKNVVKALKNAAVWRPGQVYQDTKVL